MPPRDVHAPPPRRPAGTRIAAMTAGFLLLPLALLLAVLAFAAPFSIWGWLVTVAICSITGGLFSVPWRKPWKLGPVRGGLALLVLVLVAHAALAGRSGEVRATVIPEGGGPRLLSTLLEERDVATAGAAALVATHAFPSAEGSTLLPLTRSAYARIAEGSPALPSPIVPTLLGMESAASSDALLVGPESDRVVVFLHGYAGNFAYECATVARAATEAGWTTVCPSVTFDGRWWRLQGEQTLRATIDWASARYHARRIVLAGLSNGGIGASRLAPRFARELAGVILISGVAPDAVGAGVPTLVIQGDHDGMCPPAPARAYAQRSASRLVMLHGTHFLLLEDEPAVRAAIVAHLHRVE